MNKTQQTIGLQEMEKERTRRLYAISDAFKKRATKYPLLATAFALPDFLSASLDNEISFREVIGLIPASVNEMHLEACEWSGVDQCTCDINLRASKTLRAKMREEIL